MKNVLISLIVMLMLGGMSLAMDLAGKNGIGIRANNISFRHFVSNSFGFDIGGNYGNATVTGQADSNSYNYAVGGFWAKEVFKDTLVEAGATLQGWNGSDAGTSFQGFSINPFIGAECFINEHFALDGKVFLGMYSSDMTGTTRTTSTDFLGGNLGAHIYF